jgi:hypothetical protein
MSDTLRIDDLIKQFPRGYKNFKPRNIDKSGPKTQYPAKSYNFYKRVWTNKQKICHALAKL